MTCKCTACSRGWTGPSPSPSFFERVQAIADDVGYRKEHYYRVEETGTGVTVELLHYRPDVDTGVWSWGVAGKRRLDPVMTDGQIVRALFGLTLAKEEHEAREFFTYKGKRVFGPHLSIDALVEVADRLDV